MYEVKKRTIQAMQKMKIMFHHGRKIQHGRLAIENAPKEKDIKGIGDINDFVHGVAVIDIRGDFSVLGHLPWIRPFQRQRPNPG
ncbi:MAG TPA: hypothetical protein PK967_19320 [Candidatus Hydrogenedentes bacterium]|nr:hypothetical protein [Candidatus Hydrogenedentota bacterium]